MAQEASSPELRNAFQQHEQQTRQQVQRLDQISQQLGEKLGGAKCQGIAGIISEGEQLMKKPADPGVRDAAMIAAAQKVEHYEIAGYGTARTYANQLGDQEAARLLQQTLEEEGQTDHLLTTLAERGINQQAMAGARG